jgi:hypothetical protein
MLSTAPPPNLEYALNSMRGPRVRDAIIDEAKPNMKNLLDTIYSPC